MKLEWQTYYSYCRAATTFLDLIANQITFKWYVELRDGITLDSGAATSLEAAQVAAEQAARVVLQAELEKLG